MRRPLFALLALCAGISFSTQAQNTAPSTRPSTQQQAGTAASGENERDALGMLSAINVGEISASNLALQKQVQGSVRDYATRMVKEHTDNNQKIAKWQPDMSAMGAKSQMTKSKAELDRLRKLEGQAFSSAYVTAMVKDHTDALAALDDKLIPNAASPQVRQHLQTTRHHVADHLADAKALQANGAGEVR